MRRLAALPFGWQVVSVRYDPCSGATADQSPGDVTQAADPFRGAG
ncbi:MAG: hypothetical protein QOD62_2995, partial [Actinomycetota bacterium]|nr:hypothetical protein [Actinomycetota bacterium]